MNGKITAIEDLGIVIKSKEQITWEEVVKACEDQIEQIEKQLIFQKGVKEMAEQKLKRYTEEKKSLNSNEN